MPTADPRDPEHWYQQRAEEARQMARFMTDLPEKAAMLEIADRYERLAARAVWKYLSRNWQGGTSRRK